MSSSSSSTSPRSEPRFVAGIGRLVDALTRLGTALSALGILTSLSMISYAVLMRYGFNRAPTWVDDSVGFLLVGVVMLAAPRTMREGGHIAVDILVARLGGAARRWVDIASTIAMSGVALILLVNGWQTVESSRQLGISTTGNVELPVWWLQLLLPIGGALMLVVCLEALLRHALRLPPLARPGHGPHTPAEETPCPSC